MIDEMELKKLHLQDPISVRLGNLASSVKRLGFLILSKKPDRVVFQLFQECNLFSVWTSFDVTSEVETELHALQLDLKSWEGNFQSLNGDDLWRAKIAAACEKWASRLLGLSGLLKTGLPTT